MAKIKLPGLSLRKAAINATVRPGSNSDLSVSTAISTVKSVSLRSLRGLRTKILWILVAALSLSTWLPIVADQRYQGVVPIARADINAPDLGSTPLSHAEAAKAGQPVVTVRQTTAGAESYYVSLSWSRPSGITSTDGQTLTVTNQGFSKQVGKVSSSYQCNVDYSVAFTVLKTKRDGSDPVPTKFTINDTTVTDAAQGLNQSDDPTQGSRTVTFTYGIKTTYTATKIDGDDPDCKSDNRPIGNGGRLGATFETVGQVGTGSLTGNESTGNRQPRITKADVQSQDAPTHTVSLGLYFEANAIDKPDASPYFQLTYGDAADDSISGWKSAELSANAINYCENDSSLACSGQSKLEGISYDPVKGTTYALYVTALFRSGENANSAVYKVQIGPDGTIRAQHEDPNWVPPLNENPTVSGAASDNQKCGDPDGKSNPYGKGNSFSIDNALKWAMCGMWLTFVEGVNYLYNAAMPVVLNPVVCSTRLAEYLTTKSGNTSSGKGANIEVANKQVSPEQAKKGGKQVTSATVSCSQVKPVFARGEWGDTVFRLALNLVNYVIILVLLFLSFVNILHINIDTYGVKKVMPSLVYGVILANFGLFITRLIADVGDVLMFTFGSPSTFATSIAQVMSSLLLAGLGGVAGASLLSGGALLPIAILALFIIAIVPFLFLGVLALLFWVRFYVVMLLAALSPLAFIAMALPMTQSYFKQWWDNLLKWVFMAPISFFFLYLLSEINPSIAAAKADNTLVSAIKQLLITGGLMYAAIQVPFSLGGNIMGAWGGALKKAGAFGARTTDKWLGDLTKHRKGGPINFQGIYQGWKERNEEREQELLGETKAHGRASSEAWSRGAGALLRGGRGELNKVYEDEMTRSRSIVMQNLEKQAESSHQAMEGEYQEPGELNTALMEAIGKGNFEAAKTLFMVAARRGSLTDGARTKFMDTFGKSHYATAEALEKLIPRLGRKAEDPESKLLSSAYTRDKKTGALVKKDEAEIIRDEAKVEREYFNSHGRTANGNYVRRMMIKNEWMDANGHLIRNPGDMTRIERAQFERFRGLERYNVGEEMHTVLHQIDPEVKLDTTTFGQAIPDADRANLVSHLRTAVTPGGVQAKGAERQALATKLRQHDQAIADYLNQEAAKLHPDLHPKIYQAGVGTKNFDEWKEKVEKLNLSAEQKGSAWAQLSAIGEAAKELRSIASESVENMPAYDSDVLTKFVLPTQQPPRPATPPPNPAAPGTGTSSPIINPATGQPFTSPSP